MERLADGGGHRLGGEAARAVGVDQPHHAVVGRYLAVRHRDARSVHVAVVALHGIDVLRHLRGGHLAVRAQGGDAGGGAELRMVGCGVGQDAVHLGAGV